MKIPVAPPPTGMLLFVLSNWTVVFDTVSFFFLSFVLGLPIQVRDAGLSFKDDMPKSDVNKEYYTQNMEREVCCHLLDIVLCLMEESYGIDIVWVIYLRNVSFLCRFPTLMERGQLACWVKPHPPVTCCSNWPGPHLTTKGIDRTFAPSG